MGTALSGLSLTRSGACGPRAGSGPRARHRKTPRHQNTGRAPGGFLLPDPRPSPWEVTDREAGSSRESGPSSGRSVWLGGWASRVCSGHSSWELGEITLWAKPRSPRGCRRELGSPPHWVCTRQGKVAAAWPVSRPSRACPLQLVPGASFQPSAETSFFHASSGPYPLLLVPDSSNHRVGMGWGRGWEKRASCWGWSVSAQPLSVWLTTRGSSSIPTAGNHGRDRARSPLPGDSPSSLEAHPSLSQNLCA